jgi:hypothetical protein
MATFIKIASVTVGSGGSSTIDFTSIPNTYTDLCVKLSLRSTSGADWSGVSFNGSSSPWALRAVRGDGTTSDSYAFSSNNYGISIVGSGYTANTFASIDLYIPNYAGSSYKSFSMDDVTENNGTLAYAILGAQLWSNTAAINQVTITHSSTFAQYSTATLYGIKNS